VLFHHCKKFGAKKVAQRRNYGPKSKFKIAAVRHLGFFENLFSEQSVSLGWRFSISVQILVQKCRSTPKLWPKIEIQDGGRPPCCIFENPIFEHCDPLDCRFSITVPNLAQKCRSTPKLWPKIEIQDGGRPPSWICHIIT